MQQLRTIWQDPTLRMIAVATMLFGTFAASFSPYISLIGIEVFGLSDGRFALLLFVSLIISVLAAVGVGIMTDQRPLRKTLAMIAVGSIVVGTGLVWMFGTVWAFVIAHMLILPLTGTILGQLFAITRLYTQGLPDASRDGITSTVRAVFAIPFAIVLPLWGVAFDAGLSLLALYPAMAVLGLAFLWMIKRHWPDDDKVPWVEEKSSLSFTASMRELLTGTIVWRIIWMGAVHSGSTLMGILLALVFSAANGRGPGDVGLFFGGFVAIEILVMLSVGTLIRYMSRLYIICAGGLFYAIFLGLLPVLAPYSSVWLLIIPAAVGGGLIYGLSISYLQDLLGNRAGAGSSLVALQRLVSEGMAAAIFAIGAALGGYHIAAFIGSAAILIGMGALLLLDRRQVSKNPGPA